MSVRMSRITSYNVCYTKLLRDSTGREIERALVAAVRQHPNIHIYENHIAVDLITESKVTHRSLAENRCLGAYVLDKESEEVLTFVV